MIGDLILEASQALYQPTEPTRDAEHRRSYADRPVDYIQEILGERLTWQQRDVVLDIASKRRVALRSGNNLGKTWLFARLVVWYIDCVGEQLDDKGQPFGARVLLLGPDLGQIRSGLWGEVRDCIEKTETRGFKMPGRRYSGVNQTKLWTVAPRWEVEAMAPQKQGKKGQSHSKAGRHQRFQMAIIEEVAGVPEPLIHSALGMCSGHYNKIAVAWNPTERDGYAAERIEKSSARWHLVALRAIDHDNIRERREVFPGAIGIGDLEEAIREDCKDMGAASTRAPIEEECEFVYALPPAPDSPEPSPRDDGILGHAEGKPRIYRPIPGRLFEARYLGRYPVNRRAGGLFDATAVDASMRRWDENNDPAHPFDQLAYDAASLGPDDHIAAGAWFAEPDGTLLTTEMLLRQWNEFAGVDHRQQLQAKGRIRVSAMIEVPRSEADVAAEWLVDLYPDSPMLAEDVGDGRSALNAWKRLDHKHRAVSVAGAPPEPVPGEWACGNLRASMYCRLAMLVNRGLIDLPPDEKLREELLAIEIERRSGKVFIVPKKWLKHRLSRSPDRADACAMVAGVSMPEEYDGPMLS